ncbi:octopamine receptor beta-1R-like [Oculina patagonica]
MVFPQVIAGFHALIEAIGLPANLLVIVTIALERRFHVMRYILLASLAVSDSLLLILANSFRIASTAQERWLYGQTMCYLNPFFGRYFYFNTVLHLIAVSYERYSAIVKSPMTYDGTITKGRVVFMIFIWVAPIPLSIGPFVGWGQYVYNPEVYTCDQGWAVQNDSGARKTVILVILTLVVPLLVTVFLNWSVFKAATALQRNVVQVGDLAGSDTSANHLQEMSRRRSERKAAVDVCIIIAAFMVCYLPFWTVGICRQFIKRSEVPAEAILLTNVIFFASTLCNPIIYSVRKRDFRAGVKNVLRRMRVCGSPNDIKVACHKE